MDAIDILLVDDDETWVDSTGAVLEHQREAFAVTTATTLESAREAFETVGPDCVVCDYQLEYGTGLELLETIRAIDPDRPFLLVTGAGNETVASDAISRQVTDYLPKRMLAGRDDVLARRIETTAHSYRAERALAQERRSKEAMLERRSRSISGRPSENSSLESSTRTVPSRFAVYSQLLSTLS